MFGSSARRKVLTRLHVYTFTRLHGSGAQMEQQLAAMSQETKSMRHSLAQEQQRHSAEIQHQAQEIQLLQDRITTLKANNWDVVNNYKNFKLFSGGVLHQVRQSGCGWRWERLLEEQAEAKDWDLVKGDQCPVEAVQDITVKLHNVSLSPTIGEARAAIGRCRGNGLWAWKKLSAALNPRTLASGVKAISQVLNPRKITNAPTADTMIDAWEDMVAQ